MSDTVIVRRKHHSNFTTLPNKLIRDQRLSWKALGILVFLLSLPPDFRLRLSWLIKQKSDKQTATRSGLGVLENCQYLEIKRKRHRDGTFSSMVWLVTDESPTTPVPPTQPCSENRNVDPPDTGLPNTEIPPLQSTVFKQGTEKKRSIEQNKGELWISRWGGDLQWPSSLSPAERAEISKGLQDLSYNDAQMLLTALAEAIRSGAIRTTPVQWWFGVLRRFREGRFVPTGGVTPEPADPPDLHGPAMSAGATSRPFEHLPGVSELIDKLLIKKS